MKYARIIDGVVDSISYDLPYFEGRGMDRGSRRCFRRFFIRW